MTRFSVMLVPVLGLGCLVDPDEPCGINQQLAEDLSCVCNDGLVLDERNQCVPCGANEVADGPRCVCAPGKFRTTAGTCEDQPPGLGNDCSVAAADCPGPLQCVAVTGDAGYCTSIGCSSSADCVGGYACDTAGAPPFCMRPPVGMGQACSSPADCAGTEATYCDNFMAQACLVEGCTMTPDDCFEGWRCCDFTMVGAGTLCIQADACPF